MKPDKESFQSSQQGSGSAENKGEERTGQQSKTALSDEERKNLAAQMGEGPNALVGLKDLGALSGRDDSAGGSGDQMEQENTGKPTDR